MLSSGLCQTLPILLLTGQACSCCSLAGALHLLDAMLSRFLVTAVGTNTMSGKITALVRGQKVEALLRFWYGVPEELPHFSLGEMAIDGRQWGASQDHSAPPESKDGTDGRGPSPGRHCLVLGATSVGSKPSSSPGGALATLRHRRNWRRQRPGPYPNGRARGRFGEGRAPPKVDRVPHFTGASMRLTTSNTSIWSSRMIEKW